MKMEMSMSVQIATMSKVNVLLKLSQLVFPLCSGRSDAVHNIRWATGGLFREQPMRHQSDYGCSDELSRVSKELDVSAS